MAACCAASQLQAGGAGGAELIRFGNLAGPERERPQAESHTSHPRCPRGACTNPHPFRLSHVCILRVHLVCAPQHLQHRLALVPLAPAGHKTACNRSQRLPTGASWRRYAQPRMSCKHSEPEQWWQASGSQSCLSLFYEVGGALWQHQPSDDEDGGWHGCETQA